MSYCELIRDAIFLLSAYTSSDIWPRQLWSTYLEFNAVSSAISTSFVFILDTIFCIIGDADPNHPTSIVFVLDTIFCIIGDDCYTVTVDLSIDCIEIIQVHVFMLGSDKRSKGYHIKLATNQATILYLQE
eukprot:307710_1